MPLIGAPVGTYVTLRLYKRLTTNPALMWANNYEFVNEQSAITADDVEIAIQDFSNFEGDIHLGDTQFDRGVMSSWVEDGEPYDPSTFTTYPLSGLGQRVVSGDAMSLNYCLFVRRNTTFGQNGKLFYRRVLVEPDVNAPSGTPALVSAATLNTTLQTAITANNINLYMDGSNNLQLRMKSALLIDRPITGLTVAGARVMQFNNRYFDVP